MNKPVSILYIVQSNTFSTPKFPPLIRILKVLQCEVKKWDGSERGRTLGGGRQKGKELNGRTENSEMHTFFSHAEILQIDSYNHYAE